MASRAALIKEEAEKIDNLSQAVKISKFNDSELKAVQDLAKT